MSTPVTQRSSVFRQRLGGVLSTLSFPFEVRVELLPPQTGCMLTPLIQVSSLYFLYLPGLLDFFPCSASVSCSYGLVSPLFPLRLGLSGVKQEVTHPFRHCTADRRLVTATVLLYINGPLPLQTSTCSFSLGPADAPRYGTLQSLLFRWTKSVRWRSERTDRAYDGGLRQANVPLRPSRFSLHLT